MRLFLTPISLACALRNRVFIHGDGLVWFCPSSEQGHVFSRQLVRVWDAVRRCDVAKVQAQLGKNSCSQLNYLQALKTELNGPRALSHEALPIYAHEVIYNYRHFTYADHRGLLNVP